MPKWKKFWVFDKGYSILLERRDSQIEYYGAQPNLEEMGIKYSIYLSIDIFFDLRNYIELEPPLVYYCYLFWFNVILMIGMKGENDNENFILLNK